MFSDTTNPPMPSKTQTLSRTSDHPRSLHLFVSLHLQHFYPFNLSVFGSVSIHMEIKAFTDFHQESTHAKHLVSFIESPRFEDIMEMDHIPPPKISYFLLDICHHWQGPHCHCETRCLPQSRARQERCLANRTYVNILSVNHCQKGYIIGVKYI